MIPQIIHYCWFGRGKKNSLIKNCIESWHKYMPTYQIKEWNEDNFNLDIFPYVREAYNKRKYAFVADVARLYALYTEGGIYMDTDIEVIKPLDYILQFEAVTGYENRTQIQTAFMASHKGHPLIKEFLGTYKNLSFIQKDGKLDTTTNVLRLNTFLQKYGYIPNGERQVIAGLTILPQDYFCPKSTDDGKIRITQNTLAIHHFASSWQPLHRRWGRKIILYIGGARLKFFLKQFFYKS